MYLCQHSQRHSRVQHCKDQGRGRYIWPALTIPLPPPFALVDTGSPPGCTSCWTQPPLCNSLHFSLNTVTSLQRLVATSLHKLLNLSRCLPAVHLTSLNTEYVWCRIPLNLYLFPNFMAKHYIQVFVEQEHISGKMHHSNWRSGTRAGQWLNLTWSALILIWASGGRPPLNCIMVRRSECPAVIVQCIFYIWCIRTSVICNCMYCVLCEWLSCAIV